MDTRDDGEPLRPVVTAIHIAPASRLPMRRVETIRAEAGKGLVGDRYHGTRHRHVTVQSQAALDEAAAELGAPVDPAGTRRNVTISGGDVPDVPGARIRIGDVQLEVVRRAAPCKLLDDTIGPGANAALRRRAGSVFRVLTSGSISVGDPVEVDARAGTRRLNRGSAAGEGRQHPGSGQAADRAAGRGPRRASSRSTRSTGSIRSTRSTGWTRSRRSRGSTRPTDRAQRRDGRGRAEGQDRAGRHGRQADPSEPHDSTDHPSGSTARSPGRAAARSSPVTPARPPALCPLRFLSTEPVGLTLRRRSDVRRSCHVDGSFGAQRRRPRCGQRGAVHVDPGSGDRERRHPVDAGGPATRPGRPAMGGHHLRARPRRVPPARWSRRRPVRAAPGPRERPGAVRRGLSRRRALRRALAARDRPGRAGGRGRAGRAGRVVDPHQHVHRGRGPQQGARHLRQRWAARPGPWA